MFSVLHRLDLDLLSLRCPTSRRGREVRTLQCLEELLAAEAFQLLPFDVLEPDPQEGLFRVLVAGRFHQLGISRLGTQLLDHRDKQCELGRKHCFRPAHPRATTSALVIAGIGMDRELRLVGHAAVMMSVTEDADGIDPVTLDDAVFPPSADIHNHRISDVHVLARTIADEPGLDRLVRRTTLFEQFVDDGSGSFALGEGGLDVEVNATESRFDFAGGQLLHQAGSVELELVRIVSVQAQVVLHPFTRDSLRIGRE